MSMIPSVDMNTENKKVSRPRRQLLEVTDQAAEHIKTLLDGKDSFGVRVRIKSGGCSGYKYVIEYARDKDDTDILVADKGINLLIDRKAELFLIGSVMDYQSDLLKSGFTFKNPNEKSSCGCGESFNV